MNFPKTPKTAQNHILTHAGEQGWAAELARTRRA